MVAHILCGCALYAKLRHILPALSAGVFQGILAEDAPGSNYQSRASCNPGNVTRQLIISNKTVYWAVEIVAEWRHREQ